MMVRSLAKPDQFTRQPLIVFVISARGLNIATISALAALIKSNAAITDSPIDNLPYTYIG